MKRLLPILMAAIFILAACGEAVEDRTSEGDDSSRAGGSAASPTDVVLEPTPTLEPSPTPTEDESFIVVGGDPSSGSDGENTNATPDPSEPVDVSTPGPSGTEIEPGIPPTPTPVASEPVPAIYPTLPTVPEVTSCEHAADLILERLQIWLDALGLVPEEAAWDDSLMPDDFRPFEEAMDAQMSEIESAYTALGCDDEEIEVLVFERVDTLEANNPNAEMVLEILLSMNPVVDPDPEPTEPIETIEEPLPTFEPIELDWNVESCQDAAGLFINRMQLLLNEIAAFELEDFSGEELPEPFVSFEADLARLSEITDAIGCDPDGFNELVAIRIDELVAYGPMGELLLEAMREAVENGEILLTTGE